MLRLNSMHRAVNSVPLELLTYCFQRPDQDMFTCPSLPRLLSYNVLVATCGATHLLFEMGVDNVVTFDRALADLSHSGTGNPSDANAPPLDAEEVARRVDEHILHGLNCLKGHFTHVIVDEASQALEPEELLPLFFAGSGCGTVLCGDHKQLGPIVRSPFCREHGFGVSLLERLMGMPLYDEASQPAVDEAVEEQDDGGDGGRTPARRCRTMTKLVRNYRSHGALLALPSRLSYGGVLRQCADDSVTNAMGCWNELVTEGFPMLFYGCTSAHDLYKVDAASAHPSSSYRNVTEAEKLVEPLETMLGRRHGTGEDGEGGRLVTTNDIGIVTPFRAQVLHLRDKLRKAGLGAVRVGTVDDYQGQEELIIVISTVIGSANKRAVGNMAQGLMSSPQRFNVAITRAKALLVIIGDPNALWEDVSWRELLQYAVDKNCYRGCAHPLIMEGVGDDAVGAMAALITQRAQRTLLGSGSANLMFPGLMGASSGVWGGVEDIDEELGWRQF